MIKIKCIENLDQIGVFEYKENVYELAMVNNGDGMTWEDANNCLYIKQGWKLPNVEELKGLIYPQISKVEDVLCKGSGNRVFYLWSSDETLSTSANYMRSTDGFITGNLKSMKRTVVLIKEKSMLDQLSAYNDDCDENDTLELKKEKQND